jgi:hypothetical protein
MLPYGVGVKPDTPRIKDVIRHEQTGLLVDPKRGTIYGAAGAPIGAVCADGYVRLGGRGGQGCIYAHRLIWETVNGPIPAKHYIDHLNGQKGDNRITNLEAVTPSENALRAIAMGFAPIGEAKANAKLTEADVLEIRQTVGTVATREWARRLEVNPTVVRAVRQGRGWRHVPLRPRAATAPASTTRRNRRRR